MKINKLIAVLQQLPNQEADVYFAVKDQESKHYERASNCEVEMVTKIDQFDAWMIGNVVVKLQS